VLHNVHLNFEKRAYRIAAQSGLFISVVVEEKKRSRVPLMLSRDRLSVWGECRNVTIWQGVDGPEHQI
jgi:hypothetical protein